MERGDERLRGWEGVEGSVEDLSGGEKGREKGGMEMGLLLSLEEFF